MTATTPIWKGPNEYDAACESCEWSATTRNAMGLAAQHWQRTGHPVAVERRRLFRLGTTIESSDVDGWRIGSSTTWHWFIGETRTSACNRMRFDRAMPVPLTTHANRVRLCKSCERVLDAWDVRLLALRAAHRRR